MRPDGIAATFEERGLPISSLVKDYTQYQMSGRLPSGFTIEISEIAPAFGQQGGGIQILVKDSVGVTKSVQDLLRIGVLIPVKGGA